MQTSGGWMEIVTSWELKGRAEGQRSLLERQLERKLGTLPDTVLLQLATLPSSQLVALGEALLDFTAMTDLETWLAAPPPPAHDDDDTDEDEGDLADED